MREIKLSIIICTYKREQYVLNNIQLLSNECRSFVYKVFVIDNGKTIDTKLSDGFINIIPNKNLGGSGGYARGMYEAHKEGKSTHIMLMDDDIEFSSKTIKDAYNKLLNLEDNELNNWIGFGMVSFDEPDKLYECGAYWGGIFAKRNNKDLIISSEKPLNNSSRYNYSAWWSLIMPLSVVNKYGYPFPFFIKFDDTEYGLRRKNEKILFDKKLVVKHESFKNKYSSLNEYYAMRNPLITNIFHFKNNYSLAITKYLIKIGKLYLKFNHKGIAMANMGLHDFLKGPKIFIENDMVEFNNNIRKIYDIKINGFWVAIYAPFSLLKNLLLLAFRYKKVRKDYINNYKYLTSTSYWLSQFETVFKNK